MLLHKSSTEEEEQIYTYIIYVSLLHFKKKSALKLSKK
jgi:hypothetical protein